MKKPSESGPLRLEGEGREDIRLMPQNSSMSGLTDPERCRSEWLPYRRFAITAIMRGALRRRTPRWELRRGFLPVDSARSYGITLQTVLFI